MTAYFLSSRFLTRSLRPLRVRASVLSTRFLHEYYKPDTRTTDEQLAELSTKSSIVSSVHSAVSWLTGYEFHVQPLRITSSNAAVSFSGFPFSKAFCEVETANVTYLFGNFFLRGIQILDDFSRKSKLPEDKREKILLMRLLKYLNDKETQQALWTLDVGFTETEVTAVYAVHLFSQLGFSEKLLIDHGHTISKPCICPCGLKTCHSDISDKYGDTSIGNAYTWHGSVDILLQCEDVIIQNVERYDPDEDQANATDARSVYMQMVAETIVFSFLQKKVHPTMSNFLIPSIGISKDELCFFFYDSKEDVLMKSINIEVSVKTVSDVAVALWLVINYKYFCNGLSTYGDVPKSGFIDIAGNKRFLYENCLEYGRVCRGPKIYDVMDSYGVRSDTLKAGPVVSEIRGEKN